MPKYIEPSTESTAFTCPFCEAIAHQNKRQFTWPVWQGERQTRYTAALCSHCDDISMFADSKLIYPKVGSVDSPNSDMPEEVRTDYLEASLILNDSPRGAAALLRLAIQKLLKHSGEKGKNINDDIASLVSKKLPAPIQQALDVVRVVGNDSVHPGSIDVRDNPKIARQLFDLVNLIVDELISRPKNIDDIYTNIVPQSVKDAIKRRDS